MELIEVILMAHHPILGNAARLLEAEDVTQILASSGIVEVFGCNRLMSELLVQFVNESTLENHSGFGDCRSTYTKRS